VDGRRNLHNRLGLRNSGCEIATTGDLNVVEELQEVHHGLILIVVVVRGLSRHNVLKEAHIGTHFILRSVEKKTTTMGATHQLIGTYTIISSMQEVLRPPGSPRRLMIVVL
jgi:hypothetical protein